MVVAFCGVSRCFVAFCGGSGDGVHGVCMVVSMVVSVVVAAGGWGWEVHDSRMMEDTGHLMKQSVVR